MKTLDGDLSLIANQQKAMLDHLISVRKYLQGGMPPTLPPNLKGPSKDPGPSPLDAGQPSTDSKPVERSSAMGSSPTSTSKPTSHSVASQSSPQKGHAPVSAALSNATPQPCQGSDQFPGPPNFTQTSSSGANTGKSCTDAEVASMIQWLLETAETFCSRLGHVEERLGKQKQQLQILCAAKAA